MINYIHTYRVYFCKMPHAKRWQYGWCSLHTIFQIQFVSWMPSAKAYTMLIGHFKLIYYDNV